MAMRRVKGLKDSGRVNLKEARRAVHELKRAKPAARKRGMSGASAKLTADRTATGKGLIRFRVDHGSDSQSARGNASAGGRKPR